MTGPRSPLRTLLPAVALAVLLVTAGCLGTPAGPSSTTSETTASAPTTAEPPSPTTTDSSASPPTTSDGYYRAYTVLARETTLAAVGEDVASTPAELAEWHPDEAAVVREAAANGSAARVLMGPEVRPSLGDELVAVNGTYYRVNASVEWRENVTAHSVHADGPLGNRYDGAELAPYEDRAVDARNLSAADRRVVADTVHVADHPFENYHGIGNWYHFEDGTVPESSVFADGEERVVRYEDTLWAIRLDPMDTSRQVRYRVRYTLDPVATNESAWHRYLRAHEVTTLASLPVDAAGRDVVRRAIDDGRVHWEGTTADVPSGFAALRTLRSPQYVVRNGTVYRVEVRRVVE